MIYLLILLPFILICTASLYRQIHMNNKTRKMLEEYELQEYTSYAIPANPDAFIDAAKEGIPHANFRASL